MPYYTAPHSRAPYFHLINGQCETGSQHFDVINPATGEAFAQCPEATQAQLNAAIAAANRAFPEWSARSFEDRAELLVRFADDLRTHLPVLAELLTREQGKPLARAREEFERSAMLLEGLTRIKIEPEVLREDARGRAELRYRPLGVVGAITPWNTPIVLAVSKIAQALYVGNTLVLKPSPYAPLATLRTAELAGKIFPPGVINVLAGGADMGRWMTEHPDIAKISFTGSVRTGKHVAASCAMQLKRYTLELGGNDAAIVLDDVDVETVAPQIFWAAFPNSGQVCMAIKRLYVHERVYEPMVQALARIAREVKVGPGTDPEVSLGPLQNRMQYEIVQGILDDVRQSEVRVFCGGQVLPEHGYFIAPVIVADALEGMRVVDEEPFGPVLPVLRFSDIDDAVRRANATTFGLGSSVWSSDACRAAAVGEQLSAGTTWINTHLGVEPVVPFGGIKQSGMGVEYGALGLKGYMQAHVIKTPAVQ